MPIEADLHAHSTCSDGTLPPGEVVVAAARAGLKAIALTDHDTIEGIDEAISEAPPGLEVIPALELSSSWLGREIHLLLYHVDPRSRPLREFLEPLKAERRVRAEKIVARLNRLGIGVTLEEVLDIAAAGSASPTIGRPHIAEALVRRGAARDLDDAFDRYLRQGQPAHVPRSAMDAAEAIRAARAHHAAVVLAHPGLNLAEAEIEALARAGLDGIEVWHPRHDQGQRARLEALGRRLGLTCTGGSDFHGPGRGRDGLATAGVPMAVVAELGRRAWNRTPV